MTPYDAMLSEGSAGSAGSAGRRSGWRIVVDELLVETHIGLHPHEQGVSQPVVIDASLHYRGVPSELGQGLDLGQSLALEPALGLVGSGFASDVTQQAEGRSAELIDYDGWCTAISDFLTTKPHTRLLEMLAVEIAALSFDRWPALDALSIFLYKPKIRPGTRRLGVALDWQRADYAAWRARNAIDAFSRSSALKG